MTKPDKPANTLGTAGKTALHHGQQIKKLPILPTTPYIVPQAQFNHLDQILGLPEAPQGPKLLLISGLAGIGKTELALRYAHSKKNYTRILWFPAHNKQILLSTYRELLDRLRIKHQDATENNIIAFMQTWFTQAKNWLAIYDGILNHSEIMPFLPQKGQGHLLLTSTIVTDFSQSWDSFHLRMPLMKPEDAKNLLMSLLSTVKKGSKRRRRSYGAWPQARFFAFGLNASRGNNCF